MLADRPCHGPWTGLGDSGGSDLCIKVLPEWDAKIFFTIFLSFTVLVSRWMEHTTIAKTLKCMFGGVLPSDTSRNMDIKHRGVLIWIGDPSPIHSKNRSVRPIPQFRTDGADCVFMLFDTIHVHHGSYVVLPIDIYWYIYIYNPYRLSRGLHRCTSRSLDVRYTEIYEVGDNTRAVKTSMSPHRKHMSNIVMLIYRQ